MAIRAERRYPLTNKWACKTRKSRKNSETLHFWMMVVTGECEANLLRASPPKLAILELNRGRVRFTLLGSLRGGSPANPHRL